MIRAVLLSLSLLMSPIAGAAQDLAASARLLPEGSALHESARSTSLHLRLTQGVPFRAYTLDAPKRLVFDFREVDLSELDPAMLTAGKAISAVRVGAVRPGWTRIVLDLKHAMIIDAADIFVDTSTGWADIIVVLDKASDVDFKARSGAPDGGGWSEVSPATEMKRAVDAKAGRPITIMLDPGHGGIDPGAQGDGTTEADLMLILAREIRDALVRTGDVDVVLSRNSDRFVSLERRVQLARAAGADAFISLHADALASGKANGAAVFTLSEEASDAASAALAERHNRADLLAGVDLSGQDDEVASILLDLARLENAPRSRQLARGIILGINGTVGHTYKRPIQSAGFSVLKAADIPSVLVEVGFLSSQDDLGKLLDPIWRGKMVAGIRDGILAWLITDAAEAELRRK